MLMAFRGRSGALTPADSEKDPCLLPGRGSSILSEVKPLTGEPDAGEPHVRFGGRGGREPNRPSLPLSCYCPMCYHPAPAFHTARGRIHREVEEHGEQSALPPRQEPHLRPGGGGAFSSRHESRRADPAAACKTAFDQLGHLPAESAGRLTAVLRRRRWRLPGSQRETSGRPSRSLRQGP